MNYINVLDAILNGNDEYNFLDALLVLLVAVIIVFGVLLTIIGFTHFSFKGLNAVTKKIADKKNAKNAAKPNDNVENLPEKVEIKDDDMMVAVLTATIDYQNEIKKDVRVVSVKEIK